MQGKIIILNGTSSAGKTSISKQFQELADGCYYNLRMDRIHSFLPQKHSIYGDYKELDSKFENSITAENKKGFYFDENLDFCIGEYAKNICEDYLDLIYTFAKKGRNIIADMFFIYPYEINKIASKLKEFNVYFIGVHCDLEELRRREQTRGDRTIGTAERLQKLVDFNNHDYIINSTHKTPAELARELYDFIEKAR